MCVNIIYYVCICLYCVICLILYYRSLLICTNKEFMIMVLFVQNIKNLIMQGIIVSYVYYHIQMTTNVT